MLVACTAVKAEPSVEAGLNPVRKVAGKGEISRAGLNV